ncbi:hypothetical protein [Actinomadura sp. DC4]|uniref:hypothetical protein n=1 Tax=Actinomadura sp. DC4 TaxID=3055069 RepID=UPI0025B1E60C|nr:hypothetical protein [Actinomadura sp. DC4]MDN3351951.1 hypothetical protein [Actinomadura sp. DC4]
MLTFTGETTTVEVEVAGGRLVGQVLPPGPAEIEVRSAEGTTGVPADDLGRFTVASAAGPFSLRLRLAGDRTVVTDWISGH